MRLKGITNDGICRLARIVGQQDSSWDEIDLAMSDPKKKKQLERKYEEDTSRDVIKYGKGNTVVRTIQKRLREAQAEWTDEGWWIPGDIDLSGLGLTRLPLISEVGGEFDCSYNQLVSLEGAPQSVGGDFYCAKNQLVSLEGAPQSVGGNFNCIYNDLDSLDGAPQEVGGNFYCYNNQLTSLEGAPQKVSGYFNCSYNQLTSLEGAPQSVDENFSCANNPGNFSEEDVRAVCDVGGDIFSDFDDEE